MNAPVGAGGLSELAQRAARGNRPALDALLRALEGEMLCLACWKMRDVHAARDAVQDSMMEIARGITTLADPLKVRSWAMSIVSHNAIDAGRRRPPAARPAPGRSRPDIDRELILGAMQEMPDEYRQALLLRHLQGFEYAEIAQTLGIPLGTVRSRIARGDELLTRRLEGKL